MKRLLLVSNRLPVTVQRRKGSLHYEPSIGGLSTGLGSFYKSHDAIWIGWPGIDRRKIVGKEKEITANLLSESCYPVFLSQRDIEDYYNKFCNTTIWPLFHYFPQYAVYKQSLWESYERGNRVFADAVVEVWKRGDTIWVHDYHLMLVPQLLREMLPEAEIGFSLHIPFPSLELFRLLPWREQILEGLLGADLLGFHTFDYTSHFLDSVHRLLGYESTMGKITTSHIAKADVFPIGIDFERFAGTAQTRQVQAEIRRFKRSLGDRKTILSIDRLDYTKGITQRLEAFDLFLERNPEYAGKVVLILVVVPSRTVVGSYALLKKQIDELVGAINGRHGSIGRTPIWYLYRSLPFHSLVALYNMADICLVTPLRDGMNLIAKEYVATKTDGKGVLVLSETAGAAKEMGEAIVVNVNSQEEIVRALEQGLAMPEEEQVERNRTMQDRLQRYNVKRWADEFLAELRSTRELQEQTEAKSLNSKAQAGLLREFHKSKRRLMLLDYDGTLVPFSPKPAKAKPGEELTRQLGQLAGNPKNEVVLISGRDRDTLDRWFGGLDLGLVAEHGAWIKEKGAEWQMAETLTSGWKQDIRPILELCVDRTPGSFVEEKEFSLVWHYRKADPRLGELRARQIVRDLKNLTANLNLQVLEGNKVVEVKNAGISKGRAASRWTSAETTDFILAVGDDVTDEDVFEVLPDTAWSIKVGFGASAARFNVSSPVKVRSLLKEMTQG